ncbi:MAG: quaternary ammonium transporter [Spirulinaceae cyanobacterium SM2_1_0]|nr:quaternary ammonium transporter [Spirulinaceae cyanobacterium SM2_1_0]
MRSRRLLLPCLLGLLTLFVTVACSGNSDAIRVASKNFAEQEILGEMYAQVLEANGYTVERKLNLGATDVAQQALENDEIDLYPEYTGTGLLTVLKQPLATDSAQVYEAVKSGYAEEFDLVWLEPSPMNNTYALSLTPAGAAKHNITTISELVAKADEFTMVGPPEFVAREDGLPGLKAAYGDFELQEFKGVEIGLRYKDPSEDTVVVGFATDGQINELDLVVLEDDQNAFPPYQVAPVVQQQVLDANPELAELLNRVTAEVTNAEMQRLNNEVTGNEREPDEVAQEFLTSVGLLE